MRQASVHLYTAGANPPSSIFYILVEVPSNSECIDPLQCVPRSQRSSSVLFKRLGSWYLGCLVIGFGVVSIATAFIHNLAGVIVTRIFLGCFEGVSYT